MTRAAQRAPVSVRFASDEEEAEARRRAARKGVPLATYLRYRAIGRSEWSTRSISTPYILEQLRELDDYLAAGETSAARERIAHLRTSLG